VSETQGKTEQKLTEKAGKGAHDVKVEAASSFTEKLVNVIQKNRRLIFGTFAVIVLALLASVIGLSVQSRMQKTAFAQIDDFEQRHSALHDHQTAGEITNQEALNTLLDDVFAFAQRSSQGAAARAFFISAQLFEDTDRWQEAELAWAEAAKVSRQSYMTPIALFNAGNAAERQGNMESAIAYYTQLVQEHESNTIIAPRAHFAIGRLEEARGNTEAALDTYRSLLIKYPHTPVQGSQSVDIWPNLAQNRIITLSE